LAVAQSLRLSKNLRAMEKITNLENARSFDLKVMHLYVAGSDDIRIQPAFLPVEPISRSVGHDPGTVFGAGPPSA
jgi:hypothetical protein